MTENRDPGGPARRFTADLVGAAMTGTYDEVADALGVLGSAGSPHVPAEVVGDLVDRCASVVRAHHPADPGSVFTVVVANDQGRAVAVDRLPPGPLAALRALLAALGDDGASRDIQVELATRGEPDDVVGVVVHLLVWLVELSDSSAELPSLSCFTP